MKRCVECEYLERSFFPYGKNAPCYRCGHPDQDWIVRFNVMRGRKSEPGVIKMRRDGTPYVKDRPQFCPYKFEVQRERRQANAKATQSNT